jgi:hypothetical protein
MARPTDLDTFVFKNVPTQAQGNLPELTSLPTLPDKGADNLPAVQFPELDLPIQANLPDWFDLG